MIRLQKLPNNIARVKDGRAPYQARALVPLAAVCVDGFAEAGLVRGQETVVVEIRPATAAQRLLERHSVSMRHHIVQDGVYCAVGGGVEREKGRNEERETVV